MMKYFAFTVLVSATFVATPLAALVHAPWLGNVYEFETKGSYEYTHSHKLDTSQGSQSITLHSNLIKAGLLFTMHPEWDVEIEASALVTAKHSFNYDATKLAVRHVWLDDLTGDAISLTTGAALGVQQESFLRDLSVIRHGPFEALFHIAAGKEFGFSETQYYNAWIMGELGVANHSSAWTTGEAHMALARAETHFFDIFLKLERGLGSEKLRSRKHFHGYSHIAYRYADLGVRYDYYYKSIGSVYIEAKTRLHAQFCPKDLYAIELGFDIPFSF